MSKNSNAPTAKKAASAFKPLDLKPVDFSLTAGTDIPAPPESPPQTPARPPTPGGGPLSSHPTSPATTPPPKNPSESKRDSSSSSTDNKNAHSNGAPKAERSMSPTLKHPLSPAVTADSQGGSKRPSSMRRFLGFKGSSSNDNLRNGNGAPSRPMSPETTASSSTLGRSRRKSGSWFNKRRSGMFGIGKLDEDQVMSTESLSQEQQQKQQKKGPPPPSLPSFQSLGTALDGGALGADDMFKNIK
ncbi:hypothetical protein K490DRAFT_57696 [Saccharata proteae CBS 121410]|uniref:Uncharacterized protein n=1 Tax=Saccharata proteae CBS 121410 TaxID=1314787 RepID=A0A9P4HRT6_9PEZI|nr:hypothetical protein K490DRAFT_57696 [Saccharata proteae CBS 121410]